MNILIIYKKQQIGFKHWLSNRYIKQLKKSLIIEILFLGFTINP